MLVFSDDDDAMGEVCNRITSTGLRGVRGGPLKNSRVAEALTGVLLSVNKAYRVKSSGIRITGLPDETSSGLSEEG